MADNYLSEGDTLELTAPSGGVTSGTGYVVGSAFVVALTTAAEGATYRARRVGKFLLPKEAAAATFAEGETVYWDDTSKQVDNTDAAFYPIGYAEAEAGATDTTAVVVLAGTPTVVVGI